MLRKRVISALVVNQEERLKNFFRNMDPQFFNLFHVHNLFSSEMYAFL